MPPRKKLRQTELTFFKKTEKTDTGTIVSTYLFTYFQTNCADNVTSWVEDWRQAQKMSAPPQATGPCTPIRVCLQTHVSAPGERHMQRAIASFGSLKTLIFACKTDSSTLKNTTQNAPKPTILTAKIQKNLGRGLSPPRRLRRLGF